MGRRRALSNKNIENSARATAWHNDHVRQSYRTEFPKFRMRSEGDGLMERYIGRKKQRNQAGQTRGGMEWVFVWRSSQSSPLTFHSFTTEARDFHIHGTRLLSFYCFPPYEFTVFIIRCFAITVELLASNANWFIEPVCNEGDMDQSEKINLCFNQPLPLAAF